MRRFFIVIVIGAILTGCSAKKIGLNDSESARFSYLDTIDCASVRENAVIETDSIPPQPLYDDFLIYQEYPKLLNDCIPDYPSRAIDDKKTAEVTYTMYVDKTGCVIKVEIISCTTPGYGFEEAAMECVYCRKYIPVVLDDKPVGVWISENMAFVLP